MKWLCWIVLAPILCVAQDADLLLRGGVVWTGAGRTTAVAVKGNRIVATGEQAAGMKAARTIELKGRFAMPGFNDAHIHLLEGSLGMEKVDLTGICTLPAIQKAIRDYAILHPEAEWITGGGWEYTCFPGYRLPTKEDIDAVVADRPVFLMAYDGHTGWANSKALRISEVETGKIQVVGEVVRGEDGKATGVFKEGATYLVSRHVPKPTREAQLGALVRGMKLLSSMGITSVQNASRGEEEIAVYAQLLQQKRLTVRASLALGVGAKTDFAPLDKIRKQHQSPMLAVRAVKFFLDGVIETHTAWMLEPYAQQTHGGAPAMPQEGYEEAVKRADAAGWQIYTHAIGDRSVRVALDAYEKAANWNKTKGARHRIEHIEVLHPDDLPRFAKLGVLPVMQPIHAYPSTVDVWSKAVGPKRLPLAFPWASLAATGARLTFSSDWPASLTVSPIRGIHNAVNRRTMEGKPAGGWIPAQRVTLEQALRAYTASGAYASFEEGVKGKLVVGQLADIVVLDRDPFAMPAQDLYKLNVTMTICDGRVVYGKD